MTSALSDRDYLSGQLIIAMPNMGDPRFERSVVLMCSHGDDHAMGVVINKTIKDARLGELIKQVGDKAAADTADDARKALNDPVFYGGPVREDRGLVIHTLDYRCSETLIVNDEIGVTGTTEILAEIAAGSENAPSQFLLALGHAGWSGGQLEEEIAMNAWAHGAADLDIVFAGAQQDCWRRSLERLGVTGAMLSPEWAAARPSDSPLN
ncbi:MAG: YqgE/AlgH family protein [Pseudomonadota bacterium]